MAIEDWVAKLQFNINVVISVYNNGDKVYYITYDYPTAGKMIYGPLKEEEISAVFAKLVADAL